MQLEVIEDGFRILQEGRPLLEHSIRAPAFFVGLGHERMDMYRGNFDIEDYLERREPLGHSTLAREGEQLRVELRRFAGDRAQLSLTLQPLEDGVELHIEQHNPALNRFWCRLNATAEEQVWGCGEQMSYFNLRGRHFPLWTSEPGVGRDKSTYVTWQSDVVNKAGGDYYHTNYPQPTFVSSHKYFCHLDTTCYADFDFRAEAFHELQVWEIPKQLLLRSAPSYLALIEKISAYFGRQPLLPDWVYQGAILGLKRGEEHARDKLKLALDNDLPVSAIWCEDWAGVRETSFGVRLFWDWKWQPARYPKLDQLIGELNERGIRFLGYVNPYLCVDGDFFPEAEAQGYFAKDAKGNTAIVDFGEFECGVVDFTNPEAYAWFKQSILQEQMIDFGLSGWMADFGEYLPIDVQLHNGVSAKQEHNHWPSRWAQINAEAVAERGKTEEITFFMRAGYTGVQRYCPLLWAGDQSVDFSRHDGLVSVISGALSSGMLGNAYHHSDIGGYTSIFGNQRDAELFKRWAEMAAFTPVMRTHESNRPAENVQWFEQQDLIDHFAHMTRIYTHLAPYLKALGQEARDRGTPVQRPLFLHHEDDPRCYEIQDQYLYGPDLVVAPVHQAGKTEWTSYLPQGRDWVHLWSGQSYHGGAEVELPAPFGEPPVFYAADSDWAELFRSVPRA